MTVRKLPCRESAQRSALSHGGIEPTYDREDPTVTRLRTALLLAALWAAAPGAQAQQAPAAPPPTAAEEIDQAKSTVGKWVATQELIFKERKAWQQEREILTSRVELLDKEIAAQQEKLNASRQALGEANAKRAEVESGKSELSGTQATLAARIAGLEAEVRALYKVLPEVTREKVDPLFRRMPEDSATTKVSLAERTQNVLGILNEINRIGSEITLATEIRPLSDGKPSEVKTVYLGLAQAYFVSARGEAGVGFPGPDGWQWTPSNELAPQITQVIQVLENKLKPQFVSLPATIR